MTGAILFDTNNLQTFNRSAFTGIITNSIDYASIAQKNLSTYALAHANMSAIPFLNYPSKLIKIKGAVAGSSPSDLDSRLDTFRSYFLGKNKNLDIETNGATRRFIATSVSVNITVSENKKFATFEIDFLCIIPFGQDTATTTALNGTGRTLSGYTDNYTFLGTAPFLLPKITITLTAVSSSGSQQLFWGNNDNGQSIVITRTNWTAGDVVVIDVDQKTVTVNGLPADYTGAFPEFSPGLHGMIYGDTFTSRTMTENVVYYKRYL